MIAASDHAYPQPLILGSVLHRRAESVSVAEGSGQLAAAGDGRAYQRVETDERCDCVGCYNQTLESLFLSLSNLRDFRWCSGCYFTRQG